MTQNCLFDIDAHVIIQDNKDDRFVIQRSLKQPLLRHGELKVQVVAKYNDQETNLGELVIKRLNIESSNTLNPFEMLQQTAEAARLMVEEEGKAKGKSRKRKIDNTDVRYQDLEPILDTFLYHDQPLAEKRRYVCKARDCTYVNENLNHSRKHVLKEHVKYRFLCELCEATYTQKERLKPHYIKVHKQDESIATFLANGPLMRKIEEKKRELYDEYPENAVIRNDDQPGTSDGRQ